MAKSIDPHHNIFFYYAGSSKATDGHERQIEDNTTKALINLLELSANSDPDAWLFREFFEFLGLPKNARSWSSFALQRATIGDAALGRVEHRVLLGIAPELDNALVIPRVNGAKGSRPDAWIWTQNSAVCIETKVVGKLDPEQLARHAKTLGEDVDFQQRSWKQVYHFFSSRLRTARSSPKSALTAELLEQFVGYLRIIAYRQEIDMGEFDGFRREHFAAFTFLDDDEAEDSRRQVKHYLGQFVEAVREALPASLQEFSHKHVGTLALGGEHAWATLSRSEKMVHEAHFSFAIRGDEFSMKLLLEGAQPTRKAMKRIESDPGRFLQLIQKLPDWEIVLNRRWQLQAQKFKKETACRVMLDCVGGHDVTYLIEKMRDLSETGPRKGYFMLVITRRYAVDSPEIRKEGFAAIAAEALEELLPVEEFLTGGAA